MIRGINMFPRVRSNVQAPNVYIVYDILCTIYMKYNGIFEEFIDNDIK